MRKLFYSNPEKYLFDKKCFAVKGLKIAFKNALIAAVPRSAIPVADDSVTSVEVSDVVITGVTNIDSNFIEAMCNKFNTIVKNSLQRCKQKLKDDAKTAGKLLSSFNVLYMNILLIILIT